MAKTISRDQVFQSLTGSVTPESAEHLFQLSLQATGLQDKASFTPDEVLSLSNAMMDHALKMLEDAEQELFEADFFGPTIEGTGPLS